MMVDRGGLLQPAREQAAIFELGFGERGAEVGPFEVGVAQLGLLAAHALLGLGLPADKRVVLGLKLGAGRMVVGFGALEQIGELLDAIGDVPRGKADVAAARAFPVHVALELIRGLCRDGIGTERKIQRIGERRVVPHQEMPAFVEGGYKMHEEDELCEILEAGQRENLGLIEASQVAAVIVARLVNVGSAGGQVGDCQARDSSGAEQVAGDAHGGRRPGKVDGDACDRAGMLADAAAEIVVGAVGAPGVAEIVVGRLELAAGIGDRAGDREIDGVQEGGLAEAIGADEAEDRTFDLGTGIRLVGIEVEVRKRDPRDRRQGDLSIGNVRHLASPPNSASHALEYQAVFGQLESPSVLRAVAH